MLHYLHIACLVVKQTVCSLWGINFICVLLRRICQSTSLQVKLYQTVEWHNLAAIILSMTNTKYAVCPVRTPLLRTIEVIPNKKWCLASVISGIPDASVHTHHLPDSKRNTQIGSNGTIMISKETEANGTQWKETYRPDIQFKLHW